VLGGASATAAFFLPRGIILVEAEHPFESNEPILMTLSELNKM
jgi:hypothetical protein